MSIQKKLLKNIFIATSRRSQYFKNGRDRIAQSNLQLLKSASSMAFCLITVLDLLTPLILSGWKITASYIVMPFITVPFYLFSILYKKKNKNFYYITTAACLLFYAVLFAYVIYISAIHINTRATAQIYLSMIFIFAPVIFIIPQRVITFFLLLCSAVFLCISYQLKPLSVYILDQFSIIAAFLISHGTAFFVWSLRLSEDDMRRRLEYLSRIDRLTGILNKGTFEEESSTYLTMWKGNEECTFLIIDLDNFKKINDTYGHIIGDELLDGFGHNLLQLFRANDLIGRIGGDEFAVLIKNISSQDIIQRKAAEIKEVLTSILPQGLNFEITCSIGATIHAGKSTTYHDLFQKSDIALYQAKNNGKSSCIIYTTDNSFLKV